MRAAARRRRDRREQASAVSPKAGTKRSRTAGAKPVSEAKRSGGALGIAMGYPQGSPGGQGDQEPAARLARRLASDLQAP